MTNGVDLMGLPGSPDRPTIAIIFEGGIGDALVSLTCLSWLAKAHRGAEFVGIIRDQVPWKADCIKNIVETHPLLAECVGENSGQEWFLRRPERFVRIYHVFPPAFFTAYFRATHPRLDHVLLDEDREVADGIVEKAGGCPVLIHPFCSEAQFNWSPERWRSLVRDYAHSHPLVLVGGSDEPEIPGATLDLRGKLTIRQTVALVHKAKAVLASRSFVGMAAADAGRPTVVLTPPLKLEALSSYYFPPAYVRPSLLRFLDTANSHVQVLAALENQLGNPCVNSGNRSALSTPIAREHDR